MKIMTLRASPCPASAAGQGALNPNPHPAGHSQDATHPSIEPTSVTGCERLPRTASDH